MSIYRASNMDLIMACGMASYALAERPNVSDERARVGTGAHEIKDLVIKERISGEEITETQIDAIRTAYGMTLAESDYHLEKLRRVFANIDPADWTSIATEVDLSFQVFGRRDMPVGAHGDVVFKRGGFIAGVDYKSGRVPVGEPKSSAQMQTYALGAALKYPDAHTIEWTIYQPFVDYRPMTARWSREYLTVDFQVELERAFERGKSYDPGYTTGAHCQYCPARKTCPALNAELAPIITGMDGNRTLRELSPEKLGEMVERVKIGKKMLAEIETELKRIADESPIPLPDGSMWGPVEAKGNREIDALRAWNTIRYYVGEERMANLVKIQTGEMERQAILHAEETGQNQERGWKGHVKRDLWQSLSDCKAVTRKPRIEYRKQKRIETNE